MRVSRVVVLVGLLAGLVGLPGLPAHATDVIRLSGSERIGTATAIAQNQWPDGGADWVVLARADVFADAVTATPLASGHGPVLLTPPGGLAPATAAELRRVLPPGGTVFLAGGTAALSPAVEADVVALGLDPERIAGQTRFGTAAAMAERINPSPRGIWVADGATYADALLASSWAGASTDDGVVVVLSNGSTLPAETVAYLDAHPEAFVTAVGSTAVEAMDGRRAEQMEAADPYALSVLIASLAYDDHSGLDVVAVASGEAFPDALAGGAHAATLGIPLLLTRRDSVPSTVQAVMDQDEPATLYIYGGTAAVSTDTADRLARVPSQVVSLTRHGVNEFGFGRQADSMQATITGILGQPTADSGYELEPCTEEYFQRTVRWGVLEVTFESDGDGDDVKLGAWLLGGYATAAVPSVPTAIQVEQGITLGTTWADLQQLGAVWDGFYDVWDLDNRSLIGELDQRGGDEGQFPPAGSRTTAVGAGSNYFLGC